MSLWAAGFYASRAISEGAQTQGRTSGSATTADVKELEARLERALLTCEAMWSLLRDKLGVTDLDLINRINDIDLSDGQLDGKVRREAKNCPKCGRTIGARFTKCMYCGQVVVHDPFA